MKASVNISVNEMKRLFLKAVKDGGFSEVVITDITYRVLDRVERDYPHLLSKIHKNVYRRHQKYLADEIKRQRERNLKAISGEIL